jgi:hypothetical protein
MPRADQPDRQRRRLRRRVVVGEASWTATTLKRRLSRDIDPTDVETAGHDGLKTGRRTPPAPC